MKDTRILYALAVIALIITGIFAILKTASIIRWSWLAVFSPTLGFIALEIIFGIVGLALALGRKITG